MKALILVIFIIALTSCNKRSTTSFILVGEINNYTTGAPISNAKIDVYEVSSSGSNPGTNFLGTTYSTADGSYSLEIDRNLVENYIVSFTKVNFFSETVTKNFEEFTTENDNVINLNMKPSGWVRFEIKNIGATNSGDQIKIFKESGSALCDDCCDDGYYYFDGANVDTTWTCPNLAGRYFVFHYWDLLGSFYTNDSMLTVQGDTIVYSINY